jgi:hypothetical protein
LEPQQTPVTSQKRASVQQVSPSKQPWPDGQQSPAQIVVWQVQSMLSTQVSCGSGQDPAQVAPQPSSAPHAFPAQFGTHMHVPDTQVSPGSSHVPWHRPMQPSSAPHGLPSQSGTHAMHSPNTQTSGGWQSQPSQLSMHSPLTHSAPGGQFTP